MAKPECTQLPRELATKGRQMRGSSPRMTSSTPTSSCPDRRDSGVIRASLFDWQADARVKPAHDGFW
jgi:hypothetical protein